MTDDYLQLSKHLAFKTLGPNGQPATTSLSKVYQTVIDNAILNISKGQETYASEMRKVMRVIADNGIRVTDKGIKTVDYPSGYTRRLDSTVRMNILDGMRDFSNELQKQFGKEFGAAGGFLFLIGIKRHAEGDIGKSVVVEIGGGAGVYDASVARERP